MRRAELGLNMSRMRGRAIRPTEARILIGGSLAPSIHWATLSQSYPVNVVRYRRERAPVYMPCEPLHSLFSPLAPPILRDGTNPMLTVEPLGPSLPLSILWFPRGHNGGRRDRHPVKLAVTGQREGTVASSPSLSLCCAMMIPQRCILQPRSSSILT